MTQEQLTSKFVFILHADVAGSTELVQLDEQLAHQRIQNTFHRFSNIISRFHGEVRELRGDALLSEFERASDAVAAALAFQLEQSKYLSGLNDAVQPAVRVGIASGEVVVADNTVTGAGVVLAQRIENLAEAGDVCITGAIHEALPQRLPFDQVDLGEHKVKGFDEVVRVYRVKIKPGGSIPPPQPVGLRKIPTRKPVSSLNGTVIAILILIVAGGITYWYAPWPSKEEAASVERMAFPLPDKPSIAVLPFDNMSNDEEQEYFADGMTEDLITDLSKISGLFVIARNSVFAYKDKSVKVKQIAEELGVRYVLEGSVRRAGNKVRINAQLIDATTGGHLWADRFDRDYIDIFALQDEVIEQIIGAMSVRITKKEKKNISRIPTKNLEAYDHYLRAEQQAYGSILTVNVALGLYQDAINLDPEFAEAYAGYARMAVDIWRFSYDNFLTNPVAQKLTYEAASRALELDPELPRAYSVLGFLQLVEGAFDEAIESGRRAVALGPSSVDAYLSLGLIQAYVGQTEEAVDAVLMAQRLDPDLSPRNKVEAGFIYLTNREPEKALALLEKARESMPENERLTEYLSASYARAGRMSEARAEIVSLHAVYPFTSLAHYRTYYSYYKRKIDLEYYLGAMRDAGLREWPFGFNGRPEDRLNATEVKEVSFGRSWIGTLNRSQPFFQEIGKNGAYAYRSGVSFVVGHASAEGELLCLQSEITNLGVKQCGYLYRNPDGAAETNDEYIYVHPFFLMMFGMGS